MTQLSDTRRILLSTAAQREAGSLYPLPDTLRRGGGTAKAVAALIRAGLAEERQAATAVDACREEGDLRYCVYATRSGLAAIGAIDAAAEGEGGTAAVFDAAMGVAASRPSKAATVVALLSRADGATLADLVAATGWLPHTTRAALTGLRKKGHAIVRGTRDGATCYRITVA